MPRRPNSSSNYITSSRYQYQRHVRINNINIWPSTIISHFTYSIDECILKVKAVKWLCDTSFGMEDPAYIVDTDKVRRPPEPSPSRLGMCTAERINWYKSSRLRIPDRTSSSTSSCTTSSLSTTSFLFRRSRFLWFSDIRVFIVFDFAVMVLGTPTFSVPWWQHLSIEWWRSGRDLLEVWSVPCLRVVTIVTMANSPWCLCHAMIQRPRRQRCPSWLVMWVWASLVELWEMQVEDLIILMHSRVTSAEKE